MKPASDRIGILPKEPKPSILTVFGVVTIDRVAFITGGRGLLISM